MEGQILEGPVLAVSKPIFAIEGLLFSTFKANKIDTLFATLQTLDFQVFASNAINDSLQKISE